MSFIFLKLVYIYKIVICVFIGRSIFIGRTKKM